MEDESAILDFSTRGEEKLYRQKNVDVQCEHEMLVCGQGETREYSEYIDELRCLINEQEFQIDVVEFNPGHTDLDYRSFTPTLQQFLRDGPTACISRESKDLKRDHNAKKLRWIHVSCNNTAWVPEVLQTVADDSRQSKAFTRHLDPTAAVLDREVWQDKENVPRHRSPHGRYMTPLFLTFLPENANEDGVPPSVAFNSSPTNDVQALLYVSPR